MSILRAKISRVLLVALMVLGFFPLGGRAEESLTYTLGDTLHMDESYEEATPKKAKLYGVVNQVDSIYNIATIRVFDKKTGVLKAVFKRIASGKRAGDKLGKQLYFYPSGRVEKMEVYVSSVDNHEKKNLTVLNSETLLYPDGNIQEKVKALSNASIPKGITEAYERTCYYPSGVVQYQEKLDQGTRVETYYDEEGKETTDPKEKIAPLYEAPEFPGGLEELFRFLSREVRYPEICSKEGIQGRVICQFTVSEEGKITDVEIVRSGGHWALNKEAIRVMRAMPRWKPGTQRGKPMRVKYTVPINFKLD